MSLSVRHTLNRSFTGLGILSVLLLTASLLLVLGPIFTRGLKAFFFQATVEHRRFELEKFGRGHEDVLEQECRQRDRLRQSLEGLMDAFGRDLKEEVVPDIWKLDKDFREVRRLMSRLLGPRPGSERPVLVRDQYGATRWDKAQEWLEQILYQETWVPSVDGKGLMTRRLVPRAEAYRGTALEPLFGMLEQNLKEILQPRWTFYWRFLTDESFDAHLLGGIWAEVLGTFYLVLGTMCLAIPLGVVAAVYLTEFAREGKVVSFLRTCISTLAGVPSIVFGLFGLAFFINTLKLSAGKSVLAGSLTLSLLVLPTIIRASEEAIRAVPRSYKEGALSLGASTFRTVLTVILPAAMPGILTGIVISMGRAAGETAPIIFTAAVSVGQALKPWQVFSEPSPALSWNVYNLVTEHEAVDQIRHVQFGMVFTLVLLVLLLNLGAILLRARVARKLRG